MSEWTARRILKEIAEPERRREILEVFWKEGEEQSRHLALAHLAKALRFREQTLRQAPAARKAELLASRIGVPELDEALEQALMTYHTSKARDLMAALLDRWSVPHDHGLIEAEEYRVPAEEEIDAAVDDAKGEFPPRDILLYLATAGLLMGEGVPRWREAAWPVVDRRLAAGID